jgi:hypothetical protein
MMERIWVRHHSDDSFAAADPTRRSDTVAAENSFAFVVVASLTLLAFEVLAER